MRQTALFAFVAVLLASVVTAVAQVGIPWPGPGTPHTAGGGGSTTAWTSSAGANNANTTVSTTTVSGDTVTSNSSTLQEGNRANNTGYTAKTFVLYKIITISGAFVRVGYCSSSTVLNSSGVFCAESDANGVTLQLTNGVLRNNNNANAHQFNGGTSISGGSWIEMAYDPVGNLAWVRISTNNGVTWGGSGCTGGPCWNDSNTGQDPNTATGGLSVTATGPFFLYYADNSGTVNQVQLDCNSGAYNTDLPTGFSRC